MPSPFAAPASLVDLLDRVLDRGLIIDADILICLAGIPLVGITLKAALAGVETMVSYGLMHEWDQRVRDRALHAGAEQAIHAATSDRG